MTNRTVKITVMRVAVQVSQCGCQCSCQDISTGNADYVMRLFTNDDFLTF